MLVQQHQANYARILSLRQTSAVLDQHLRQNVQLLADIRRDIKAVSPHVDQPDMPEIPVDEILSYAQFISKTSVPPTLHEPIPEVSLASKQADKSTTINGTSGMKIEDTANAKKENIALQAVDEQTKRNLDPLKDVPFEPWPAYAVIQQGALAEIQKLVDAGKDPAGILTAQDQAEADRLRQEEEEQERLEDQRREMRRMSTFPSAGHRSAAHNDVFDPDEV